MRSEPEIKNFPLQRYYSRIYRRYDLVNRLFTWGMDVKWRRIAARTCLRDGPERIIDLCCGTGDLALELKKQAGNDLRVTGYDFSEEMLDQARKKAAARFSNLDFIQGDASDMPFRKEEFDALTIGFGFRNLTYRNENAPKHLAEISRIMKKRGRLYILESAVPSGKLIRFFYNLYLRMILIPLGGLVSGQWKAYRYLALSSANYYKVEELERLLADYGFRMVSTRTFFMGAANLLVAEKQEIFERDSHPDRV